MEELRKIAFFDDSAQVNDPANKIILYHGSDFVLERPLFNYGRDDNDYGRGFYTTRIYNKAVSWAKNMGASGKAFVNEYSINLESLNVINLDDFGVLAWIAEIAAHRPIKSDLSSEFLPEFVNRYKVDTDDADVIIGYRADDSYTDVIGAFCDGLLTCDEVQRLFYKGNLGEQYFIKSEEAFNHLEFVKSTDVSNFNIQEETMLEMEARNSVFKFIENRKIAIAKRFQVPPITIIDAISDTYHFNKEYGVYEIL